MSSSHTSPPLRADLTLHGWITHTSMILCCTFQRQRDKAKTDLLKVEGRQQIKGLMLVDVNMNGAASKLKCCVHGFINWGVANDPCSIASIEMAYNMCQHGKIWK